MESGAALVQPGEAPVNQASNVSEAPGPLSGSSALCFRGLRFVFLAPEALAPIADLALCGCLVTSRGWLEKG